VNPGLAYCNVRLPPQVSRANFAVVDFAMTEAAYTVVRLLQRFPVLEKPDDEIEVRTGKEQQTMTLVLAITNGCRVRFAN
jgi:hypothetical protein